MDYSKLTLGELLSSENKTIRRNAISILKEYQRTIGAIIIDERGKNCIYNHNHADNNGHNCIGHD